MGDIHRVDGSTRWALMWPALRVSVLLSLLFVILYGGTNWITAQRPDADVKTWYFAWELAVVPYVPLLIIPYMSVDLLFFTAPFLCRDEQEMYVFARRMVFSYIVAAALFLLLPLKLAWPPLPHVGGWFGAFVEQSVNVPFLMEYPHNLFPALHITHAVILADLYGRHTRGLVRILVRAWLFLVGVSTVLIWQHHVIDVAGGLVLAGFACYLFREQVDRRPVVVNVRLGCYYAVGSLLILAPAPAIWPWGVFLLWPAAALGIVAAAYFGLGPEIFRKTDGQLPLSARFVLFPVLVGQFLSLVYYRRQCRPWDMVARGVLIGRVLTEAEAAAAVQQGVTAVLDLTAEFSEPASFRALNYCNIPILDLTAPTQDHLDQAVAFISAEAATGTVYVHCKIGYSRSGAVAAAYLLDCGETVSVEESFDRLREVRPSIIIRPEASEALRLYERRTVCGCGRSGT